ncbi:MAG TPA: hypothetical protein VKX17_15535 [Planctomycetota bacterium]|nr:hypothetical protein [Planctomycetota bacterium]
MNQDNRLNEMLAQMPEVAKAVNAFSSEAVQQRVLEALLSSMGLPKSEISPSRPPATQLEPAVANTGEPRSHGKKRAPSKTILTIVKDLNLKPKGKESLAEFYSKKAPANNYEKFAVFVYYLQRILELAPITCDHIHTCFKAVPLKTPSSLSQQLRNCAHKSGWIDTANAEDVKITTLGENIVEHDLPDKKRSSNAAQPVN